METKIGAIVQNNKQPDNEAGLESRKSPIKTSKDNDSELLELKEELSQNQNELYKITAHIQEKEYFPEQSKN